MEFPTFLRVLLGAINKFPEFFEHAFKIVLGSWKFSMLFLHLL